MLSERQAWQRARLSRDPRFDGRFFVGVTSTGIYCRPICPARMAEERHVRYFRLAAEASGAGFRPCLRCRPDAAPGTPAWLGTPATVQRALRLIDERAADGLGVETLASSLGIGPRHLHRLFVEHLGASPLAVVQTRRLHFARQLIDRTVLPFATVAHAAGYGSIRRFNAAVHEAWRCTPSALRGRRPRTAGSTPYAFSLAYRPPFDWEALLTWFAARAIPGVERVERGRYTRHLLVAAAPATVSVAHDGTRRQLDVQVQVEEPRFLYAILSRARAVFDLAADPTAIGQHLAADPMLRGLVRRRPGLRIPGAWDPFEIAVRAIVGQQVAVAAARTILARIVRAHGVPLASAEGTYAFPGAAALAGAPLEVLGLTRSRAAAIRVLSREVAEGRLDLRGSAEPAAVREQLMAVPGIGAWTAEYVALRALGEPDAWPGGDAVLQRVTGLGERQLSQRADAWRPWRGYAAMHLWMGAHDGHTPQLQHRPRSRRTAAARRRGPLADCAAVR